MLRPDHDNCCEAALSYANEHGPTHTSKCTSVWPQCNVHRHNAHVLLDSMTHWSVLHQQCTTHLYTATVRIPQWTSLDGIISSTLVSFLHACPSQSLLTVNVAVSTTSPVVAPASSCRDVKPELSNNAQGRRESAGGSEGFQVSMRLIPGCL